MRLLFLFHESDGQPLHACPARAADAVDEVLGGAGQFVDDDDGQECLATTAEKRPRFTRTCARSTSRKLKVHSMICRITNIPSFVLGRKNHPYLPKNKEIRMVASSLSKR